MFFFDNIKRVLQKNKTLRNCTIRTPSIKNKVCINCGFFSICPRLVESKQKQLNDCKNNTNYKKDTLYCKECVIKDECNLLKKS